VANHWIDERRRRGNAPSGVDAVPASTVVLLRDGDAGLEVLLGRRSSKLRFHGGAWVFPGGRIDPEDFAGDADDLHAAARRAAAREAKEEAGLDVDPDALVHLAHWTTPEVAPKRFATWFFVGPVAEGNAVADGAETETLQWFAPDEALAAHASGAIELAPPQWVTLRDLLEYTSVAGAITAIAASVAVDYVPRFHFVDGGDAICVYCEDVAYDDVALLDADGPRHRLYLRASGWEYLRDAARG
jgi:8-oxo-dGTP pyrophosphatase MutT (NUDIX family)